MLVADQLVSLPRVAAARSPHHPQLKTPHRQHPQSARALQLRPGQVKLSDYEAAAKKFCGKSWDSIKKEFLKHSSGTDTYTLQVCFAAAHVLSLLREGLHLVNGTAGVILSNDVKTHKGGTFSATWTLGALVVEVLRIGSPGGGGPDDGPFGVSARPVPAAAASGSIMPTAPKTDGGAAGLAAAFCVGLIILMGVLSKMRVGIIGGPGDRNALEKVRSGDSHDMEMQSLLANASTNGGGGAAAATGGANLVGVGGVGLSGGGALRDALQSGGATRVSAPSSRRRADAL